MRYLQYVPVLLLALALSAQAVTPYKFQQDSVLARRLSLQQGALARLQNQKAAASPAPVVKQKSVGKSVLFSLILPGSGQFYAKSYVKAGIFLAAEAAAWWINLSYIKKGDDKDAEFKVYANAHWSEYRYWSYVAYRAAQDVDNPPFQMSDLTVRNFDDGRVWYLIPESTFDPEVVRVLRDLQDQVPGFTHRLPTSKTQQYYEMIGKYPHQFGTAWDDASFDREYDGVTGKITPHNARYMDMRDESNRMYYIAGYGAMAALVNHVIAAIDAGFTTRRYNKRQSPQVRMDYQNYRYQGEYVNMLGLRMNW